MQVKISLPDELVSAMDGRRGDVSRSMFVRRAIEVATSGPHIQGPVVDLSISGQSRSEAFRNATQGKTK